MQAHFGNWKVCVVGVLHNNPLLNFLQLPVIIVVKPLHVLALMVLIIDHCTVSVAILDVGQSLQKLTANVWEIFQTIDPYNSTITRSILTKNVSLKR